MGKKCTFILCLYDPSKKKIVPIHSKRFAATVATLGMSDKMMSVLVDAANFVECEEFSGLVFRLDKVEKRLQYLEAGLLNTEHAGTVGASTAGANLA